MAKASVVALGSLLLLALLLATSASASDVYMASVLNTGPVQSSTGPAFGAVQWNNPYGQTIYIRRIKQWIGVDYDGAVDALTVIVQYPRNEVIASYGQDAYANGRSPIEAWTVYAPDYVAVPAGGALVASWNCWNVRNQPNCHFSSDIFFTFAP